MSACSVTLIHFYLVEDIKEKWKNLRDYEKKLRNIPDCVKEPTWKWYKHLDFIRDSEARV